MFRKLFPMTVCLALIAAGATDAQAQGKSEIDAKTSEILEKVSNYLGAAESLSLTARTSFDLLDKTGIKSLKVMEQKITVRRPNALHASMRNESGEKRELWFDGKTLTVLHADKGVYDTHAMKGVANLDKFFAYVQTNFGVTFPMIDFLRHHPSAGLADDLISGVYVGKRTLLDGAQTHYLSFESQDADWQLWVREGDRPVPVRLVVTYVTVDERPGYIARMSDWQINESIADSYGAF